MRLFFALWPPRETAEALHAWALSLRLGKPTRVENIHLTLRFLGDVAESELEQLVAPEVAYRELNIEQVRYWAHNRIVWVGPKGRGKRHVTLIRKASRPATFPPLPQVSWPVTERLLVRSELAATGSRYEVLKRFPLTPL